MAEAKINIDISELDEALEKAERLKRVLDQIAAHSSLKDLDAFIQSSNRRYAARRG